jgi:predicted transcriptional regulator
MLAVFTPKRWELIARLRETGPLTTAELARKLDRDYKNVHADVAALSEWLAVQRTEDGRVHVPWSEIVVDMKLPNRLAA